MSAETPGPRADALRRAIAALELQRATLGDEVTGLALAPLQQLLDATNEPAPQLRRAQVTVLFADIVDSTALARRLDAEDVLQVFGGMLERAAACVRARGGRVLRYTGDGLKAGFGTQGTREDDAAQAVLAGLDILAAAREHAAWVERQHGLQGFALRVGAHTGEVALGAGFEDDNTLTGETVNLAARMEQAAPAGGLRISGETWAHVHGQVEAEAQPPLMLKGVDSPMATWLVHGARPRHLRVAARGVHGVTTRMIGREAEMLGLQAAFRRLFDVPGLSALTVVAEAGVGKSRLLHEFDDWTATQSGRCITLRARAHPQTERQPFGLLRDIFADHLQIHDDDSVEAARDKMERGLMPWFVDDEGVDAAEAHAHLLGHLIGIEWGTSRHLQGILADPRQLRHRALHAAVQWLRRIATSASGPVMLQIEDLHWADTDSLDFLDQCVAANRDVPLLLLAFTRPTLFERRGHWRGDEPFHQRLDLLPLSAGPSRALADELLRKIDTVPPALSTLLTQHAEGNPFYMEELVKMLIDRGTIDTRQEVWRVDVTRLGLTTVPTTLTGVLQARLDGLPSDEKRALQQASIIGTVFWRQALASIEEDSTARLPALQRRALALPRGDAGLDGVEEYVFHHHLLQQVTYGTVLKHDRRDGHGKVARWLARLTEQGGLRAGDFLAMAAEHFELAGDGVQALEFHARAAEQATQRMAHDAVLRHVGHGLRLLDDVLRALPTLTAPPTGDRWAPEMQWRLLSAREVTLGLLARRDEQGADLMQLSRLADEFDDDHRRYKVARSRCVRAVRTADWAAGAAAAQQYLASATRAGDTPARLEAQRLVATLMEKQGDIEGGRTLALASLEEARRLGLLDNEAGLLNTLALMAERQGERLTPLLLEQQALGNYRKVGDRVREASMLSNIALRWLKLGDLVQARRDFEESLRMLRINGDRTFEGAASALLSVLMRWLGDAPHALSLARFALDVAVEANARDNEVIALMCKGETELVMGRRGDARESLERALAYADAHAKAHHTNHRWRWDTLAGLARVALAEGQPAEALARMQPLLDHVAVGGTLVNIEEPRLVELTCHQVLAAMGDGQAAEWLYRAHRGLAAQAEAIGDPVIRQGFLENIPFHREIRALWDAQVRRAELAGTRS